MIRLAESQELKSLVVAKPHNKAHTAAGNRIAKKYNAKFTPMGQYDIVADDLKVEVETSASVEETIRRLNQVSGRVYVAMTNKDAVMDTLQFATGRVGVMDSSGNIVRECAE